MKIIRDEKGKIISSVCTQREYEKLLAQSKIEEFANDNFRIILTSQLKKHPGWAIYAHRNSHSK
jgi:hypothetical protein